MNIEKVALKQAVQTAAFESDLVDLYLIGLEHVLVKLPHDGHIISGQSCWEFGLLQGPFTVTGLPSHLTGILFRLFLCWWSDKGEVMLEDGLDEELIIIILIV